MRRKITQEMLGEKRQELIAQKKRILAVFEVDNKDEIIVNKENLKKYMDYLKVHTKMPCILTGIEDLGCFAWEERYRFGERNKREYEREKKIQPSFTDEYKLLGFDDDLDHWKGLFVDVQRISDKKKFNLPLSNLKSVDENSWNYQILDDYTVWVVNYKRVK